MLKTIAYHWKLVNLTQFLHQHILKGQMHHHDDLGSKCAYMCHLSNKTTRKSVLLSTPQIWLMKVSKKTSLSLGIEAAIIRSGAYEVTASPASDWLRDISGSNFQPLISLNQSEAALAVTSYHWLCLIGLNWPAMSASMPRLRLVFY